MKKSLIIIGALIVLVCGGIYAIGTGLIGRHLDSGIVNKAQLPPEITANKKSALRKVKSKIPVRNDKQILFGDFHVHTTFSVDAFYISLPMLQGQGAHPPADACDFAKFCSNLDFWSINDHAEGITPANWRDTKQSIRQCDAVSGPANDQDLVSFLGWEWTQVGNKPENHYGHKNVVMREIDEARTPIRPIASIPPRSSRVGGVRNLASSGQIPQLVALAVLSPNGRREEYLNFNRFLNEIGATKSCPEGVHVRNLSDNCFEGTYDPKTLFRKLDEWELDSIVIPHGTSWGFYTPGGSSWDKQLVDNDPKRQTLIEVMSGHGNSEVYRDWRAVRYKNGKAFCPKPTKNYLPSCWRAGQLIAKRCVAEGNDIAECKKRAAAARQIYIDNGIVGHLTVQAASPEDWLDAGQCKDCLIPSFNYRPGGSVQYILSLTDFSKGKKNRFRFGFLASSDNHNAQPGTGYKEFNRQNMTEAAGAFEPGGLLDGVSRRAKSLKSAKPLDFPEAMDGLSGFQAMESERMATFFTTGGLVAVHSKSRSRDGIWKALEKKETYGTSGDRILLWFDLTNAPGRRTAPMGSEVEMRSTPSFIVKVAGAFKQNPGCPDYVHQALGDERVKKLCLGECYNPSTERKKITHIDVIRILPQTRGGENVKNLIKDPWKRIACNDKGDGCVVRFSDPEFKKLKRDVVYYVRAMQEPSNVVNADNLRCTYDEEGNCVKIDPCYGDYRTSNDNDCTAKKPEMAWSSPIYVDYHYNNRQ